MKNVIAKAVTPKFLLTHGKYGMQFFGMTSEERELRQAYKNAYDAAENAFKNKLSKEERRPLMTAAENALADLNDYLNFKGMEPVEPVNFQRPAAPISEPTPAEPVNKAKKQEEYKAAFLNMLRGNRLDDAQAALINEFKAAMTEGVQKDGGYIVPEDITTTINRLKQTFDNLEQYVNTQPVKTNKGQRTLEKRADSTPLVKLSEMGTIQETNQPEFSRASYAIEDFAGFMKVSNDLLADTDQALLNYLAEWFAKKSKATRNSLIIEQLNALTKVDLKDFNGIKKALNVTLDPAISQGATIFTNQDGFQYLDTLMDGNGRPLLQPDPTSPTQSMLFGHRVVVLSNKTIPTATGKMPFIIGDLKEAVILWDRKQMSLDMTNIGGEAWRTNSVEIRAIEREDVTLWDSEAVVYGQITQPVA
jgi:HK97 family phage major capsid protein